ncbi:vacuolar membrane-interacting protein [Anaplasma phagocytophilum]|uniref:130kDa protein n=3 Tax=Anaplasma phagocytophilum TaxID=948 RepID=O68220_ANAPH|nr:vacuolar membrane-interacting protein [Anaplasma phagocytophilum]pir/T08613/ hypothetical protein REA - Ehrlichia sp. (strain USG3) [Ehrlichia sp.]AAC12863.1 130kDa protein [Anaplasma phagocytophilum]ABD43936.1 conserved domain protein [Anaplasma phagocytophilum str. HZ]AGR79173.1 hypothetical protein YYU_00150 [Anaplasma phagocytophilum str. HZ2]KJV68485.1 hypothetical protein EPHNCH_0227 [Anaplasma phagocytophilum str. NCH-1]KJV86420.1 hypothetical protein APHNYW_1565 [Anaplasma phagocyt
MFEHNIPDTYTGTTAEGSPGLAGGDFSLSSIDFTRDFTIESHRGSSADDPGYISFRDQDGNVMSRFLDVYVANFSLRCKHSPYNNDRMETAAFSLTPDIIEPSALLQESHSTQNNVEEAVQVTALECPPCNPVPAEEVAPQPSFLSRIIQAFLWLFTPSSTTDTAEDSKCNSSDTSKCTSASSESLEQQQESVEVQPSVLMSTAPIATEPQNAVVNQVNTTAVQVESSIIVPESQHTDVTVLEDTTETITVDGEYGHFSDIASGEHNNDLPAMLLDEADFTMLLANEESKTLESMPSDSLEDNVQELGTLPLQEGETVSEGNTRESLPTDVSQDSVGVSTDLEAHSQEVETVSEVSTQDSLSTNISQDSVGVSTDLEAHSKGVEIVSEGGTQDSLSADFPINTVESESTDLEAHSQEVETVSEFTQDSLSTNISQDSVGVSTDLEVHSQEVEIVSEGGTQDSLSTNISQDSVGVSTDLEAHSQEVETVSEFTQDSLSTNISQDSVGVSTDLEVHSQEVEIVSEGGTQDSLSTNISQDSVGVSTDLEAHSKGVEIVSEGGTQDSLSADFPINTVESESTDLEAHSPEGEIVSEVSTQDAPSTGVEIRFMDRDSDDDVLAL